MAQHFIHVIAETVSRANEIMLGVPSSDLFVHQI